MPNIGGFESSGPGWIAALPRSNIRYRWHPGDGVRCLSVISGSRSTWIAGRDYLHRPSGSVHTSPHTTAPVVTQLVTHRLTLRALVPAGERQGRTLAQFGSAPRWTRVQALSTPVQQRSKRSLWLVSSSARTCPNPAERPRMQPQLQPRQAPDRLPTSGYKRWRAAPETTAGSRRNGTDLEGR